MMKNEFNESKKRLLFFMLMIIVGAIAIIFYSAITGNQNQVFTDVVNEFTAQNGSNKSAEKNLFYIFSIFGAIVYTLYYLFFSAKKQFDNEESHTDKENKFVIAALAVFFGTSFIVYNTINQIAAVALVIAVMAFVVNKNQVLDAVAFFFITLYSLVGVYRLYVFIGGTAKFNINYAVVLSLILTCVITFISREKNIFLQEYCVPQIGTPFLLLIFLADKYLTEDGSVVSIALPKKILIPIALFIIAFLFETIARIIKYAKGETAIQQVLSYGTCASIMAFNQYYGTGSIIDLDLHHHFEDIIGYSQIFELGREPYSQYIPVSGLYSVVQGFFFEMFGHGLISFYNVAANFYYLCVIFVIVYLLRKHLSAEWVLFLSLTFYMGSYNRVVLMAPIFLLLSLPQLIANKNLWLKLWMLTSFLHGLYYPVYGAAICLGFMPLGIWQIYSYAKEGELRRDIRTVKFWLYWIVCLLPVILGIPLLLGTARHMLAMASQTIYADGTTRFGQIVPDYFFPYIDSIGIRLVLYYLASYLVIITIVWVSVALFYSNGGLSLKGKSLGIARPVDGFLAISVAIIALVSISYSVVRCEVGDIYSRSDGFIKLSFLIIVILVVNHMKNNHNALFVFVFACFLIALVQEEGFYKISDDSKLESYYEVPEEFAHATLGDNVLRLGDCFIPESIYEAVETSYNKSQSFDKEQSYLGIAGNFGEYYFDSYKGDSVLELYLTIKGYSATQETVDLVRRNNTVIGYSLNQVSNYYIYHYLVMSGEYIWNPAQIDFIPNNDILSSEDIFASNKESIPALVDAYIGKTAGSWGSSMESLNSIFTEPEIEEMVSYEEQEAVINLDVETLGDDADFVYVEFEGMDQDYEYTLITQDDEYFYDVFDKPLIKYLMKKSYNPGMKVSIEWTDDKGESNTMICAMDEGKLLIPLGAAKGWLFDHHNELRFTVTVDDEIVDVPTINKVRMLKLREVE